MREHAAHERLVYETLQTAAMHTVGVLVGLGTGGCGGGGGGGGCEGWWWWWRGRGRWWWWWKRW